MPRICILTQYYPPEMGAPQTRLSELADQLVDRGWDVEVLTALPNYPTGKVFDGYDHRKVMIEQRGQVRCIRLPMYTKNDGTRQRMRTFLSFALAAARRGVKLAERPDILYVQYTPIFSGHAGRYLAWKWRCPFIYNVSDLWPDVIVHIKGVKPGMFTRVATWLEKKVYRAATGITGQSSEIIEAVDERAAGVPTQLITNGVDVRRFGRDKADAEARALVGSEPGPMFMYAGLMGLAQGLDQILDLAAGLPESVPGRFVLIGDGPVREQIAERIKSEQINRVTLLPSQPRERIPALLATADAAVISLGMSIPGSVPSKIYEAMGAGLPILMVAEGEAAQRVIDAGCGLVAAPGSADALRDAFLRMATDDELRSQLGTRAREVAESTYDRRVIAEQLDEFLRKFLPESSHSRQPS